MQHDCAKTYWMKAAFFRARMPEVTFEDFKNEILIIDLKTGNYHSLRKSGAHVWRLLVDGRSVNDCVAWLTDFYKTDREIIATDTRRFIEDLEKMALLEPISVPESTTETKPPLQSETYEAPSIQSYGDLQDLLLLDPIHEVVPESGWPHRREEA